MNPTDRPQPGRAPVDPQAILDRMPSGVIALDEDRRPSYVNPAGLAILGLEGEGTEGATAANDSAVRALVEHEAVATALEAAGQDRQERRLAIFLTRPDDTLAELGLTVVPGQLNGMSGKTSNHGGGRFSSVLLFRALDDSRSLNQRMREVSQLTSVGRLGAGFAHEVLNPMAAIQGLTQALLDELPEDDPLSEYGERILGLVSRIETLVRSCVDMGSEAGSPRGVKAADLVTVALSRVEGEAAVEITSFGDDAVVLVDPEPAVQCLVALIQNAQDALAESGAEGPVEITLRPLPEGSRRVAFEIRDRGPGIPDFLLGRIFEPFFTTKAQATGLGLSVARLAAVKNRGSLEVRSQPGDTVFILSLPAGNGEERSPEAGT